ncbi:MAG TPA: family 78 glycoside hydrolase catalytic domain, partial [Bacillota bacterium]|nr:family 78 glycoside hydrolase catalytic domain [Bacillota bacterium]
MAGIRGRGKGAYWIGIPEKAYEVTNTRISRNKNETAYFKTEFYIKQISKLEIKISANSRYRLWVNGIPVHSGPLKGDRYRRYYDLIDISDHLRTGYNVLAVKVVAYPSYASNIGDNFAPFSVISNGAGPYLVVEGHVRSRNNRILEDVSTGYANWQVSLDKAITWIPYGQTYWVGAMEHVDSDLLPHGWTYSKKPDGQWFDIIRLWPAAPTVSDKAYGAIRPFELVERSIPLLYEEKKYFEREMPVEGTDRQIITFTSLENGVPVTLCAGGRFRIVLDAGELTTAYFKLGVWGGMGSKISIRYAESYVKDAGGNTEKGVRDDASGFISGHEDVYIASGRDEEYETFGFRAFRFVQIDVDTGKKSLTIKPPEFLETGYPLDIGSEVSSTQDWVGGVWDISLRTIKRCMHETYEDCPYYEQLQYIMDTRSQILFTYMISRDTRLAEKAMVDFHSSLMPNGLLQSRFPSNEAQVIPIFNIYFIMMVEDYYQHTGKTSHINKYRPAIDSILQWFDTKIGVDGLVEDLGYWPFVDWVEGWIRGVPRAAAKGPSTIHNLMYV